MIGVLLALLSGALMSIQGVFNTEVTKNAGVWTANMWVQFTAFLVCVAGCFFTGRQNITALFQVENKYMLLGGVIGAFITWTVIKSMSGLGPAKAVMIIVISQLLVAYLVELLGLFQVDKQPFSIRKMFGMALAIAGIIVFKWK